MSAARPVVLHVHGRARWGGSVAHTALVVRGLAARGWPVRMVAPPEAGYRDELAAMGIDAIDFDVHGKTDLGAPVRFARIVARERPAIVHTHVRTADFFAGAGTWLARLAGALGGSRDAPPPRLVVTLHGAPNEDEHGRARRNVPARLYAASMRHLPDRVLAVSGALARLAEDRLGLSAGSVRVIPNGVDADALRASASADDVASLRRALLGGRHPALVVVMGAKLTEPEADAKGHAVLIAALARLRAGGGPEVVAWLAGDGPGREAIAGQVGALGLDGRVRLLGHWPPARMGALWAAADAAVLPSRAEGLPRGLAEPAALGRAVVGSAVGGIPELLASGRAGVLVPAGCPVALAGALARLARDRAWRTDLGARAAARVAACYGLGALVAAHERAYEELVAAPAGVADEGEGEGNGP